MIDGIIYAFGRDLARIAAWGFVCGVLLMALFFGFFLLVTA